MAVLVILVMLKDTVGSAAPLLKKPLDAIEVLVVNKAALLFAVLPVVWHEARSISALHLPGGLCRTGFWLLRCMPPPLGRPRQAAVRFRWRWRVITGFAVAFAVWLTGHALDILALLSPIPLLDVLFKACRVAIFLIVGVLAVLNSRVALLVSLVVIGICFLCFWWALRLAVFGAVFAWDILRSRLLRTTPRPFTRWRSPWVHRLRDWRSAQEKLRRPPDCRGRIARVRSPAGWHRISQRREAPEPREIRGG